MTLADEVKKQAEHLEFSLFDKENPASLINMLPTRLIDVLERVRAQMPRAVFFAERDIRKIVKPDERDERLRLAFWDEYNNSTALRKKMSMNVILDQVTSYDTWTNLYEPDDTKMLWIFTPPRSYANSMKYILHLAVQRLEELMQTPFVNANGKFDAQAAALVLKAFQLVDLRVKGAIIQNINIRQQNLNLNADVTHEQLAERVESQIDQLSLEELEKLDRKLDRVEKQQNRLVANLPAADQQEVIDIKKELDPHREADLRLPKLPGDPP